MAKPATKKITSVSDVLNVDKATKNTIRFKVQPKSEGGHDSLICPMLYVNKDCALPGLADAKVIRITVEVVE